VVRCALWFGQGTCGMLMAMSEKATADRDERGRFQTGNIGGGRPKGARSKLGEAFVEDLRRVWEELGEQALRECAISEPGQFLRVVASLMPRDLNVNVAVDPQSFVEKFRSACALLGNQAPPARLRRPLPGQVRVIEHEH
jgi:hypothetical protein